MYTFRTLVFFIGCLTVGTLGFTASVQAFTVTDQSVTRLTDDTVLFSVTYRFNFLNREARTSLLALPTGTTMNVPAVQYSLVDAEGAVVAGVKSHSLVLSEAAVRGNEYYLPEATPGFFRLISIVRLEPNFVAERLALQVDSIPLTLIAGDEVSSGRVPDEYLEPFRTDFFTP